MGAYYNGKKTNFVYVVEVKSLTPKFYEILNQTVTELVAEDWGNAIRVTKYLCSYCEQLKSVEISDNITIVDMYAFQNCTAMENAIIGSGVTEIGRAVFASCSALHTVTIKATTPPTLGTNLFSGISTPNIVVPKGCLSAYQSATNWSNYADKMTEASE